MTATADVDVRGIAAAVAVLLGGEWTVLPPPKPTGDSWNDRYTQFRAEIAHHSTAKLSLSWSSTEKRLTIRGDFPRNYEPYNRDGTLTLSITVNPARPSIQIARDIEARLLPDYLRTHAEALAMKEQNETKKKRARSIVQALCKVYGVPDETAREQVHNRRDSEALTEDWEVRSRYDSDQIHSRVKVSSYRPSIATVQIDNCPQALALAIARLVRAERNRQLKAGPKGMGICRACGAEGTPGEPCYDCLNANRTAGQQRPTPKFQRGKR